MTWNPPVDWVAATLEHGVDLNEQMRDNFECLEASCCIIRQTAFSLPLANAATLNYDGIQHDPLGMWSSGHPSRLTAQVDGTYVATARIHGTASTGMNVFIMKNGSATPVVQSSPYVGGGMYLIDRFDIALVAGDYLEHRLSTSSISFTASPFYGGVLADFNLEWKAPL